mgnify:FL=1
MRGLKRNKIKLWYQLYDSHVPVYEKDLDGNIILDPVTGQPLLTGEYTVGYKEPVLFKANVSPARSDASTDPFGVNVEYDKTICSCDLDLPIDELSMLFVDKAPQYDEDGNLCNEPDYKVVKVAKSLNSLLIAIKKRTEDSDA